MDKSSNSAFALERVADRYTLLAVLDPETLRFSVSVAPGGDVVADGAWGRYLARATEALNVAADVVAVGYSGPSDGSLIEAILASAAELCGWARAEYEPQKTGDVVY